MSCKSCTSTRRVEFLGEICLHLQGGLETLDKPHIWLFPKVTVCLQCGFAEFSIPKLELSQCNFFTGPAAKTPSS